MRKILLTMLCFLVFTSSCFAATAREVLDNYKDIEYSLESGINFRDYSEMYQKAYLAYRRWEEGVTDEAMKEAFMKVDVHYHAIKTVWHGSIYNEHWYPSEVELELYPFLKRSIPSLGNDMYCSMEILQKYIIPVGESLLKAAGETIQ